ncbi:hypothetical protein PSACC_00455 [Paramicrosporidium saccamoebae]|uniref:Uncharacterized protein n=1 Tax=Paramicrosporidium saccamoebae TaxID=1246581 RepID=A0A2H9TPZ4_9FUNG|nr:hypothetical protein PSACC_00455 [Paramicrosporidium saccamoebae]
MFYGCNQKGKWRGQHQRDTSRDWSHPQANPPVTKRTTRQEGPGWWREVTVINQGSTVKTIVTTCRNGRIYKEESVKRESPAGTDWAGFAASTFHMYQNSGNF